MEKLHKKDFSNWYNSILQNAGNLLNLNLEIIDNRYPLKGFFVFRPIGLFMYNQIINFLEKEWDKQGIQKTHFPLLIPYHIFSKDKKFSIDFENQSYWVTKTGMLDLKEKLSLKPTSETSIYDMFSLWIHTYKDIPFKIHQTCTVYRHEVTGSIPLIRSREIYWNEVHTCHETKEDALENIEIAWKTYLTLLNDLLGVYGLRLTRPQWKTFPGANYTEVYDIIFPNQKCLQICAVHYLDNYYSKTFQIKFQNRKEEMCYPYMTCYGISTRALAACISIHGDDNGLVLPTIIQRWQIVIVPIILKDSKDSNKIFEVCKNIKYILSIKYRVIFDDSPKRPGEKFYEYELKGVPIRIEIGPKDIENETFALCRRDTMKRKIISRKILPEEVENSLKEIDLNLHKKDFKIETYKSIDDIKEVKSFIRVPYRIPDDDQQGRKDDQILKDKFNAEIRGYSNEKMTDNLKCFIKGSDANIWAYIALPF